MRHVLVTINRGIIDDVVFFSNDTEALKVLDWYVKNMNPDHYDAGVYGPDGIVANFKNFLNENDQYDDSILEHLLEPGNGETAIYIIGNPNHELGFMVASPDVPLGYSDPAAALSDLGQMRNDFGRHLKLYRVVPVEDPVTSRSRLEEHNTDSVVEDFDYSLIDEYLEKENGEQTK